MSVNFFILLNVFSLGLCPEIFEALRGMPWHNRVLVLPFLSVCLLCLGRPFCCVAPSLPPGGPSTWFLASPGTGGAGQPPFNLPELLILACPDHLTQWSQMLDLILGLFNPFSLSLSFPEYKMGEWFSLDVKSKWDSPWDVHWVSWSTT